MAKPFKPDVKGRIEREGKALRGLMEGALAEIADGMISQIMRRARDAGTGAQRARAIRDLKPIGVPRYQALLLEALAVVSLDAVEEAKKQVPKAKPVTFAVTTRLEKLPPKLRSKLKTRASLLVGKQIGDLQKVIEFAYATNEDTTDSDDQIEEDIRDSAIGWLDGTALEAGSRVTAATVINDARNAFFFDDGVLNQIEAFEFINGDPVSEICQDLSNDGAGRIFSKNDPMMFRYTPPLHWNCKSYINVVLVGQLEGREIEKLRPSSQEIENSIQFRELILESGGKLFDLFVSGKFDNAPFHGHF